MFDQAKIISPYWSHFDDIEIRKNAIDKYWLNKELKNDLSENNDLAKKLKL